MGGVVGALLYLRVTTLKNAALSRIRRLKQPKYLVGALVGVAYIYWIVFRRVTVQRPARGAALPLPLPLSADQLPAIASFAALLLMVFVAFYWLWPRARAALTFSESEIAFLFPAPIGRRTLIHYRWINAQLRILFTSLVLTLVSAGWGFVPGNATVRIVGWWLVLSTLDLHAVASSFTITRLLDRGMTSLRRSALTLAIAALAVSVALAAAWSGLRPPSADDVAGAGAIARYVGSQLTAGPLAWLLLPARLVVQPLLAASFGSFLRALGPAVLIYAAHYVWVLRTEVSFEEASIAKAEKRAALRRSARRGGTLRLGGSERKAKRAPFDVSRAARPELALLWKNLLASASYLRPRVALIVAAVIVVASGWLTRPGLEPLRSTISVLAMIGALYTLAFGPMLARQDLRLDLPNTDILKTYPLRGWQLVLGEVLAPVAVLTVLLWLMLLAGALTAQPDGEAWWTAAGTRAAAVAGAAVLLPLLCTIQVLVMNTAVVLFPAWLPQGPDRATGIDVLGQRILLLAGLLFVMVVSLLPAAIGAAAFFFVAFWLLGTPVAAALAFLAAVAVLVVEIGIAIRWLGARFERFDLSAELRA